MRKSNELQRIVRIKLYYENEAEVTTYDIFERNIEEGQTLDGAVNYMLKNCIMDGYHIYRITVKLEAKKIKKGWFRK